MVELLHGSIESVHIHMDDLSKGELVFHRANLVKSKEFRVMSSVEKTYDRYS